MAKALICLADGTEAIEATTTIDVLKRCGVEVLCASVMPHKTVNFAHGLKVECDCLIADATKSEFDVIVLPGGMPGSKHLSDSATLSSILKAHYGKKHLAAICAAPGFVLAAQGFLVEGDEATGYPGCIDISSTNAPVAYAAVKKIITAKGPAFAMDFALAIASKICDSATVDEVKQGLLL